MLVLLGSHALYCYGQHVKPGIDTDILGSYDEVVSYIRSKKGLLSLYPIDSGKKLIAKYGDGKIVEAEINWGHSSSKMLYELAINDKNREHGPWTIERDRLVVPSIDLLYTLKMSHRYLRNSPHFLKTMEHIHLMRKLGAKIRPEYEDFLKVREKETYWYNHPKLNVNKADFFRGDGVKYVYDHDSIHEAVKHMDHPAYKYYTPNQVLSSRKAFEACSEETKLYGVLEEAYVLALERSQIPYRGTIEPKKSFDTALMKVCSSITSGYFREYGWENYHKVMSLYDDDYVTKFWNKVDRGEVSLAK